MSKIIVPQELVNKIIDLYVNQHMGRRRILKTLNLSFSEDVVVRILKENGIHLRNLQEAQSVGDWSNCRKYSVNDNYDFCSHNGAWLLGFIAADGYLPKTKGARNRVVITLQRRDESLLYDIAKEIQFTGKIHRYESTSGYPNSSLAFSSRKMREKIESYGIVNNKSFTLLGIPKIPEEYILDFVRGFFDGDGSVYCSEKEKKVNSAITSGSLTMLQNIETVLRFAYNVPIGHIYKDKRHERVYELKYTKAATFKLCELLYNNDFLCLQRKKEKFMYLRKKYPLIRK